jgi:hypothetical protein
MFCSSPSLKIYPGAFYGTWILKKSFIIPYPQQDELILQKVSLNKHQIDLE